MYSLLIGIGYEALATKLTAFQGSRSNLYHVTITVTERSDSEGVV